MFGLVADWTTLVNWIISGVIGFSFGALGAMVKYRFDRKRDDLAWERRLEELRQQWEYERKENERREIRAKLTDGVTVYSTRIVSGRGLAAGDNASVIIVDETPIENENQDNDTND